MKTMRILAMVCCLMAIVACDMGGGVGTGSASGLENGDIIFQVSTSPQSMAIQLATKSMYSHMGIVYIDAGSKYVYEAVQPVRITPFKEWVARGRGGHYVVKRLRERSTLLTPDVLRNMRSVAERFDGRDYDIYFQWDDRAIYCSELVWKVYMEGAGIELAPLQTLGEFDLDEPVVRKMLMERYGNDIPLGEKVVSPVAIFNSDKLYTVMSVR